MREVFVSDLMREVLGPRAGLREIITESPLNEYICGVLEPIVAVAPPPDIDDASEMPIEQTADAEEDAADDDILPPPLPAPALSPQNRPHSMGLSFILQSISGTPRFYLCVSWARYMRRDTDWHREPRCYLSDVRTIDQGQVQALWINGEGREANEAQPEISIHIIYRPIDPNRCMVSIYLVNRIQPPPPDQHLTADHHIFQPQIRVRCEANTRIVPGLERFPESDEERKLSFLYRNKPILARGHLCSAVWREIDPESTAGDIQPDFPEAQDSIPFRWIDGETLPEDARRWFSPPDCRTEFIPLHSVQSPELDWPDTYGDPPELRTDILAEMWDAGELRNALTPLVDGYRRWTDRLRSEAGSFSDEHRIVTRIVDDCETVADRIRRGIELLVENDEARLAFCFSNKAMEIQSVWSANKPLEWRPFQLAFILMTLESIVNPDSPERDVCDLLWVPTGAGKTEAYLGIAAFSLAYRRRRASRRSRGDRTGAGVSVISRYTLRLLTIQQFRRTLRMVTACELLRVHGIHSGNRTGWRPARCPLRTNFLWGALRFSIGLWVGGGVTPNRLMDSWGNQILYGALSILRGQDGEGEPAQILNCPACDAILSIPATGLPAGRHTTSLVIQTGMRLGDLQNMSSSPAVFSTGPITVHAVNCHQHRQAGYFTLSIDFSCTQEVPAREFDLWWGHVRQHVLAASADLVPARASRSGYFLRWYAGQQGQRVDYDFDIFCANPGCPLRSSWCEGTHAGCIFGVGAHAMSPTGISDITLPAGSRLSRVNDAFTNGAPYISDRIPVPAYTVDDQIYHRSPSMVIATADKFARPPFEPRASGVFGNVDHHHCIWGFYRQHQAPNTGRAPVGGHPSPAGTARRRTYVPVTPFDSPDLIIQDELHLIEGPLGSLVGIYETAVDRLCGEHGQCTKYIASTATVRRAEEQVESVFGRRLMTFPPLGLTADDRFFMRFTERHTLHDTTPGRLYMGICAPGRGPLTPIVRIWSRLLNTAWERRSSAGIDPFWTLTGYFNAIRELGGARALYRQDIPQRVSVISGGNDRPLTEDRCQELSSSTNSTHLPAVLDALNRRHPNAQDALFTTSMFGTGIDIPRIGLMVVHGQPKTTSSYIQSTGRVGRSRGALVVTFLRATRPRDLNHYEFFCGYHRQLHRFVEPITVMPFAPGVLDRACGPVAVFLLRTMRNSSVSWHPDNTAGQMATQRTSAAEVQNISTIFEDRGQNQPRVRRPVPHYVEHFANSELDRWQQIAARSGQNLEYAEYAIATPPASPVVLGDAPHQYAGLDVVYEDSPQSLRHIEETAGFRT